MPHGPPDVNDATVRITGAPREELIGSDCVGYFTDRDKAQEGLQRVFEQGVVTDFPLTVRHRDGTLTDVLGNGSLYRDEGGNVLGLLAVARDVTRQKESYDARDETAQGQALAAAEQMAAIVEYSAEAIFSCTLDEIITTWNPAAEDLYGYSSQEITGKSGSLLTPKDRPDEIKAILSAVKDGQIVTDYASLSVRKGGMVFPVSLTISPIRDAHDTVVGASAIARELARQR